MRTVLQIEAELKGAKDAVKKAQEVVERLESERSSIAASDDAMARAHQYAEEMCQRFRHPNIFVEMVPVAWRKEQFPFSRGTGRVKVELRCGLVHYTIEKHGPVESL